MADTRRAELRPREFYIPNLCAADSVVILFILAELLVVELVVATSLVPRVAAARYEMRRWIGRDRLPKGPAGTGEW